MLRRRVSPHSLYTISENALGLGSEWSSECGLWKYQFLPRLTIAVRDGIITYKFATTFIARPGGSMAQFFRNVCRDEQGQDVAEYAVMLAVILVLVIGTVRLIGGNANNAFSSVASSLSN
jgi:Flp pilus assembly pilin Flp